MHTSQTSISSFDNPSCASTLRIAGIGPTPIYLGSTPINSPVSSLLKKLKRIEILTDNSTPNPLPHDRHAFLLRAFPGCHNANSRTIPNTTGISRGCGSLTPTWEDRFERGERFDGDARANRVVYRDNSASQLYGDNLIREDPAGY